MNKIAAAMVVGCVTALPFAGAADDNPNDVGRDVGAVLAWRLGPEFVEEHCRALDPAGAEARKKALQSWLDRNATLIKDVDTRVAEIVPLVVPASAEGDHVQAVREQVKAMLMEISFAGKSVDESKAACQAEADPASPRWNNSGLPQVPASLAALHDWKLSRRATK